VRPSGFTLPSFSTDAGGSGINSAISALSEEVNL
jgi:hypothetical protein